MVRFYLVPVEVNAAYHNLRGPKYFPYLHDPDAPALVTGEAWEMRDYGDEPLMLVADNLSDAEDALLAAQSDVVKFADNLDAPMGAQLATMQSALEALNLPAQMIGVNTTHRQVIRGIIGVFGVAQCMQGRGFRVFGGAITLSTTLNSLSAPVRQALQDCAAELHYDQTGITGTSTIRQVLTAIVQQAAPSPMKGVTV